MGDICGLRERKVWEPPARKFLKIFEKMGVRVTMYAYFDG